MIDFIRNRFRLVCLICFVLTSGAGLLGLLTPGMIDAMAGTTIDITEGSRFFAQTAFVLILIIGFLFLIIMSDPDGNRLLLGWLIAEKFIFVGFLIYAMGPLHLSWMFLPVVIGDLLMGLACLLYLMLGVSETSPAY